MSKHDMTRRDFMRRALRAGLATYALSGVDGLLGEQAAAAASAPTIAVASRKGPAELVGAAVEAAGGIGKFVKRGARVLIKPNMSGARKPEQAATTNPEVVAEIVRLCKQAGAREVKVTDHAVDGPEALLLRMTGIGPAAQDAGARVSLASSPALYERASLRGAKVLKSVEVLRDLRRADVFINVPIAKVHSATGVTLGCKNLMGTVLDRGAWHRRDLDQCIGDYAKEFRPDLVILDATRVLLTNGPKGPGRTEAKGIVVAGTDPVAVDAYGAMLLGRQAQQVGHLARAHDMGVGEIDLERVKVKHV